jgi:hypothetical protein
VNAIGPSAESAEGLVVAPPPATAPDAPSFTSPPTLISDSSIHFEFSLGSDGGSALTDLQYARDTDSYQTWTSLGLLLPLAEKTTADITVLTPPATGSYKLRAVNIAGESDSAAELAYILNAGEYYVKVRFSSDNQYAIAVNNLTTPRPAVSSNGGLTWTIIEPSEGSSARDVAMSLDSNYMYYSDSQGIYKSTNQGGTFSKLLNAPTDGIRTIACDSTGRYVYSAAQNDTNVHYSDDYGENFIVKANIGFYFYGLNCDASGRYVHLYFDDTVYISNNYGDTFTTFIPASAPTNIACDQTGQKVYLSTNGITMYSINYGESFSNTTLAIEGFQTIACSSVGNHVIAMSYSGDAYVSRNAGASWEQMSILGQNSAVIWPPGASISPDGTRYVSAGRPPGTYIKIEGTADLPSATVPAAPSFTSPPTIVDTTTIHVEYTLGSNGGSALTNLQYAREEEGSYDNWISIPDLPSTIDGTSSINITGLTAPVTGNYKLRAVNDVGPSAASAAGLVEATVPCFLEGSKILCMVGGVEKYVAVETIRPGTLVKTSLHGYQPIKLIGSRVMVNAGGDNRDKNSLYLCTKANYPELTEDLIITGCHAILVDHITDVHRQGIIQTLERVFVTDKKYRLPACVDERAPVYQKTGTFTVWHFALEHTDIKMNYGVYAHGLLVESSPIWHMNTKNYKLVQ